MKLSAILPERKLLAMAVAALLPTAVPAAGASDGDIVMTNPLNLTYLFEQGDPVHRTAADPVIVLYHDRYFLFSSHAAGYSYSDNLRDWTHVFSKMPLVKEWAPAVMVYDDYIYYMGFGKKRIFRTKDPVGDVWEEVTGTELPDKGDPDFFVDDDGRTYYLWGCSAGGPMQGMAFDPKTFKPLSEVHDLMPANGSRFGWEVPGDHNEKVDSKGWNEGVSMVHEGDYYYFFYATPGTEFITYCSGAYVGKSPLGPFEPMVGSPFAIRPSGFFTGGGHGHPFKDRYGNHWYVASLIIGAREHYERRIGIFPAYYNNGYAHAIMDDFDRPFVVPNRKVDFERESILTDMKVLSTGKAMTASSTKGDLTPGKASDDDIRTWWSAQSGASGEWLQMDLGRPMSVEAVEVCFADEGFKSHRFDTDIPTYKYIVEGSADGKTWHSVADRSSNAKDQIYELLVLPKAEKVRYLRVVNKANFSVGQFSVSDLRVFGHVAGKVPGAVQGFKPVRQADRRRIAMSWQPQKDAVGYVVRWGAAKNRMNHAARVYTTSVDYGFFDSEQTYYVAVQPFNEVGLGKMSQVVELKESTPNAADGTSVWPWIQLDNTWKFSAGDDLAWSRPKFNDSQWSDLKSTDFWEAQGYYDLEGFAWYRQQLVVPKAWQAAVKSQGGLYLSYSNADDADEAFFNGVSVGKTGDFPPTYQGRNGVLRKYFIPANLIEYGKPNTVALRVYDGGGQGGVVSNDVYLSVVNPIVDLQLRLQCDDEDWVFDRAENAKLRVKANPTVTEAVDCQLVCRLTTDFHENAGERRIPVRLEPGKELSQEIQLPVKNPGFYHADIYIDYGGLKSPAASTNIGLSPNRIWSPSDAKPDFEAFWKQTRQELDAIPGNFKMQEDASLSNNKKKVYRVEMTSFGGERIKATFSVPTTPGPHPALLTNLGYAQGEDFGTVNPDNMPGYCELVLSVRGQGLDLKNNKYGEWITYGLKSKDTYYYRGAYMDLVRAVDFLCSRPEVDAENIFAGGLSQGGALTLAAAALDHRIKAAAPCVPFLSDFPDYFRIVTWPRDRFEVAMQQDKSLTWDGIYEVLSYFDIKNLARFIHCPVLLGSGLQDGICPPHTHFAGFNNIPGDLKRTFKIYPNESHGVEPDFYAERSKFFGYYTSHNAQYFPVLKTGKPNVDKAFTLAVETLFKNTPDSLIKAGGEYGGEWTRDVSINSWNAAALLMPEKTAYSLWSVTTDNRSFIGHQYWDQIIWVTGAFDYYEKTGDRAFLRQAYIASANTMKKLENEQFDADYGMFMGPSVFNDGIAGYEEPVFDTKHRSSYVLDFPGSKRIKCLSTNSIYYNAYVTLAKMAALEGDKAAQKTYAKKAADLRTAIRKHLFDAKTGKLSYLVDGDGHVHPHQETLGVAFAILFGVVSDAEARQVIANVYTGKHGAPSIYPHFKRFDKEHPGRHNQIVWPFVNAFWADAAYSKGRKDIFSFELQNLADLAINSNNCFYEIYNEETGAVDGGWQQGGHWGSVYDQTWSATGYIRMILTDLLGMKFSPEGVTFSPDPQLLSEYGFERLGNLRYLGGRLDISVQGSGQHLAAMLVNGEKHNPRKPVASAEGTTSIVLILK